VCLSRCVLMPLLVRMSSALHRNGRAPEDGFNTGSPNAVGRKSADKYQDDCNDFPRIPPPPPTKESPVFHRGLDKVSSSSCSSGSAGFPSAGPVHFTPPLARSVGSGSSYAQSSSRGTASWHGGADVWAPPESDYGTPPPSFGAAYAGSKSSWNSWSEIKDVGSWDKFDKAGKVAAGGWGEGQVDNYARPPVTRARGGYSGKADGRLNQYGDSGSQSSQSPAMSSAWPSPSLSSVSGSSTYLTTATATKLRELAGDILKSGSTTLALKNLPVDSTGEKLISLLDGVGFAQSYDFIYAPHVDGAAFINFSTPNAAADFCSFLSAAEPRGLSQEFMAVLSQIEINQAWFQGIGANLRAVATSASTSHVSKALGGRMWRRIGRTMLRMWVSPSCMPCDSSHPGIEWVL